MVGLPTRNSLRRKSNNRRIILPTLPKEGKHDPRSNHVAEADVGDLRGAVPGRAYLRASGCSFRKQPSASLSAQRSGTGREAHPFPLGGQLGGTMEGGGAVARRRAMPSGTGCTLTEVPRSASSCLGTVGAGRWYGACHGLGPALANMCAVLC